MRVVGSALESPGFGSTFFVISIVFFCFFHCCLVLKKRKTLTEKNGVLSMEKGLKTREIKGGQKWWSVSAETVVIAEREREREKDCVLVAFLLRFFVSGSNS